MWRALQEHLRRRPVHREPACGPRSESRRGTCFRTGHERPEIAACARPVSDPGCIDAAVSARFRRCHRRGRAGCGGVHIQRLLLQADDSQDRPCDRGRYAGAFSARRVRHTHLDQAAAVPGGDERGRRVRHRGRAEAAGGHQPPGRGLEDGHVWGDVRGRGHLHVQRGQGQSGGSESRPRSARRSARSTAI